MFVDEKKRQSLIVRPLSFSLSLWFASTSSAKESLLSSVIQYERTATRKEKKENSEKKALAAAR